MVYNPTSILKLPKKGLEVGDNADLAVFNTSDEFTFDKNKMLSKARNTPFDGWKLYGETVLTLMGGEKTYELC